MAKWIARDTRPSTIREHLIARARASVIRFAGWPQGYARYQSLLDALESGRPVTVPAHSIREFLPRGTHGYFQVESDGSLSPAVIDR